MTVEVACLAVGDAVAWVYDEPGGSVHEIDGVIETIDEWGVTLTISYGTGHKHLPSWAFDKRLVRPRR